VLEPSTPKWLPQAKEALRKLLSLPPNWDSYGARTIDPHNVEAAVRLLPKIASKDTPQPIVIPTVRGGVQLEWLMRGIDLEIEINEPGQCQVLYVDPSEESEWELQLTTDNMPRFLDLTARLTGRQSDRPLKSPVHQ
jgi:hypothetical protein